MVEDLRYTIDALFCIFYYRVDSKALRLLKARPWRAVALCRSTSTTLPIGCLTSFENTSFVGSKDS